MYEQKQQSPFEFSQSIIIILNKTIYYQSDVFFLRHF